MKSFVSIFFKKTRLTVLVLLFSLVLLPKSLFASTTIPEGNVSGTWTLAGSPYLVGGDITVPAGQTLFIEPGVVVEMQNWYQIIVYGDIQAVGTSSQQIVFTATPPGPGEPAWPGIDILDASVESRFEYCVIENGQSRGVEPNNKGGALTIINASPVISNSTLRNNNVSTYGGALYIENGNPVVEKCTITGNSAKNGGAVYAKNAAQARFFENIINNNSASAFSGFSAAYSNGGAVYLDNSDVLFDRNVVAFNAVSAQGNVGTHARGGAMYIQYSDPVLTNNTFYSNEATVYSTPHEGGALYLRSSNPVSVNNIFWNNSPEAAFFSTSGTSTLLVAFSDVENGQNGISVNGSGTLYYQEGNLAEDPLFTNATGEDFSLQTGSPAIDAGTAHFEWQGNLIIDLDDSGYHGAAPDMGALESGGSGGLNQAPVAEVSASTDHGSSPLTVNFSSDGSYDPDGTIVSYEWDFGDGNTSNDPNPGHTFTAIDQYSVRLIVTDDDGATNTGTVIITVQDGTTLTGGNISGTWTLSNSPYRIEGDVTVPAGATLVIEPGVTVEFISWYRFTVNGTLQATGTDSQPVVFTSSAITGWQGIDFINASSASLVDYCIIENGQSEAAEPSDRGGAFYIVNSDPVIRNSIIRNNSVTKYGGAIFCDAASPVIEGNTITGNFAGSVNGAGGAIYCINDSRPLIKGNTLSDNHASGYGGYSPANALGGAIYLGNSPARLEKNLIINNTVSAEGNVPTHARGGALYLSSSDPELVGNTIYGNQALVYGNPHEGGAIWMNGSQPVAINNILWNNVPQEIFFSSSVSGSILLAYNDVEGGQAGIVTNGTGTVHWQEGNISSDPGFVDATGGDFSLLQSSVCVNAGTAYYDWGGDVIVDYDASEYTGPAPDIGSLESEFTGPANQAPVAAASATPLSGYAPLAVQFSSAGSYDPDGNIDAYLWSSGSLTTSAANPSYTFNNPGTYLVTLTVTDNDGASSSDQLTIEVMDPSVDEVHIGGQTVDRQRLRGRIYRGYDHILVLDQNNDPVDGALVSAVYSGPNSGSTSGYTGSNGIVTLYTGYVRKPGENWCFEVTSVSLNGYDYAESDNVVTLQCEGSQEGTIQQKSSLKSATGILTEADADFMTQTEIYPNPFNSSTTVRLYLEEKTKISVRIYDVSGRYINSLSEGREYPSGQHEFRWDGTSVEGTRVKAGIYLVRIIAGKSVESVRVLKE